jgi:dihydrofolate reductase
VPARPRENKDVPVRGGAETGQQYIRAGLVDEPSIHLVSVIFARSLGRHRALG